MKRMAVLAVTAMLPCAAARAERPPIQEMQVPPLSNQVQQQSLPSAGQPEPLPLVQTPSTQAPADQAPAPQAPEGQDQGQPEQPALSTDTLQPQWPNQWVPAASATLQALDKVNAQTARLTVKVGQPAAFGSLTITVKACVVRPPDQPADAAAYLDVTDSHPDSPGFDGWLLANEPSVSMMQNPIYDLRVSGCG
ncbi:DUF2155 domain-containing protein [Rhodopila sp.]|uniref:DUF2155 domain-containing protein n=1 Tax=Rhodopila sp. TaxID=2480087 RepID=UPI003D0AD37E